MALRCGLDSNTTTGSKQTWTAILVSQVGKSIQLFDTKNNKPLQFIISLMCHYVPFWQMGPYLKRLMWVVSSHWCTPNCFSLVRFLKPRPHNKLSHFVTKLTVKQSPARKTALYQLCLLPHKLQCSSYVVPQIFSAGKNL